MKRFANVKHVLEVKLAREAKDALVQKHGLLEKDVAAVQIRQSLSQKLKKSWV